MEPLMDILQSNGVQDGVVVLRAKSLGSGYQHADPGTGARVLEPGVLSRKDYKRFADRFRPLLKALRSARVLDPEQCFVVRTLLMHEFRRTLLRDPQLPEQLLPGDWPGNSARQLCHELYVLTQKEAENHLMSVLQTASGRLPEAAPYFYERFGGIGSA
jgi:phenylacetic acid degradation operon negative regulatory protein